jgi:ribonucleoside-diphosphate reductase alpha chain
MTNIPEPQTPKGKNQGPAQEGKAQQKSTNESNFGFTANALKVLTKRYFLQDENGQIIESLPELFQRVAQHVAQSEKQYGLSDQALKELEDSFKAMMLKREFLPNSPTLMNAGKNTGQLSACFVLPVPDNLEGIFETCKNAALIHKTGGGTGFSFSRLRPAKDRVASSSGVASGPVSFMKVYDAATEAIRQGGTRRGANMGILRIDHPDIEEFIACKKDTSKLNNFNISVAITDKFMEAVKYNQSFELINPSEEGPRSKKCVATVQARSLFEKIIENAHATGEPGMVFIDRINKSDPLEQTLDASGSIIPGTEDIEATNPCGEQPLGPGDACNLGSINVAAFLNQNETDFDWPKLETAIQLAVRFLDDVIDANHYPLPFIAAATLNNRRIGLGLMGFAEALIRLGISYAGEEAIVMAERLMSFIQEKSHQASEKLAKERGVFPNWTYSTWSHRQIKMRNATVTTIAPTGTISIIASTTSGIEPLFAVSYVRRVMGGTELIEVNPLFESIARKEGFYSPQLMAKLALEGTVKNCPELPQNIRELFVCAHDIDYLSHVRIQAAFQKYTDNAVSKTINFPHSASLEQIKQAYLTAWELNLKGITVYRDASRQTQVLNIRKSDPKRQNSQEDESGKKPVTAGRTGTVTSPLAQAKFGQARQLQSLPPPFPLEKCPECGDLSKSFVKFEACFLCCQCGYTKC